MVQLLIFTNIHIILICPQFPVMEFFYLTFGMARTGGGKGNTCTTLRDENFPNFAFSCLFFMEKPMIIFIIIIFACRKNIRFEPSFSYIR